MVEIKLTFDKLLTSLAGNKFGVAEFEKQIRDVNYETSYKIIFPERIKYIATSFIQGFFQKFVETIGISGIEEKVEIDSSIENLKQLIINCLV